MYLYSLRFLISYIFCTKFVTSDILSFFVPYLKFCLQTHIFHIQYLSENKKDIKTVFDMTCAFVKRTAPLINLSLIKRFGSLIISNNTALLFDIQYWKSRHEYIKAPDHVLYACKISFCKLINNCSLLYDEFCIVVYAVKRKGFFMDLVIEKLNEKPSF